LGDPPKTFLKAGELLSNFTTISRCSSLFITAPWEMSSNFFFHNQVIELSTTLSPLELLHKILEVEHSLGRQRSAATGYQDRLIDIDILLFDEKVVNELELKVPHPHLSKRAFALAPLLELNPELREPQTGVLYQDYLMQLQGDLVKIRKIEIN
jgi:2-amino-4-hydroxy-6-hydroxymethyldihydropteridine diphosphokinase